MYVKVLNNAVDTFPYSIAQLKLDNPNTSFPATMSDETLAEWNVFPVVLAERPTLNHDQTATMDSTPTLSEGVWGLGWTVVAYTQDELDIISANVRDERDEKLNLCDWTQMPDSPLSDADKTLWQTYRQALRDVPAQTNFPTDITWPTEP